MTPEEANELLEVLEEDFYVSEDGYWNLLEQVADMRWEYAVRIDFETGSRLHVRPGITTRYADCALWRAKLKEARKIADQARTWYAQPVHIVRRMVSESETVE